MKIIAIKGTDKTGKSTTLKIFLKEILEKNLITATTYSLYTGQKTGTISSQEITNELIQENVAQNNPNDVNNYTVSFNLKGKKMGLTTYGDTKWHIETALTCLADCEIVFCACRTKGETINYLEDNYKDLTVFSKMCVNSKINDLQQYFIEYTNNKQVETLWEILNKLI